MTDNPVPFQNPCLCSEIISQSVYLQNPVITWLSFNSTQQSKLILSIPLSLSLWYGDESRESQQPTLSSMNFRPDFSRIWHSFVWRQQVFCKLHWIELNVTLRTKGPSDFHRFWQCLGKLSSAQSRRAPNSAEMKWFMHQATLYVSRLVSAQIARLEQHKGSQKNTFMFCCFRSKGHLEWPLADTHVCPKGLSLFTIYDIYSFDQAYVVYDA